MIIPKNPKANLKLKYRKHIETGLVIALALLLVLFQASKRGEARASSQQKVDLTIIVEEIPQTEQEKRPPAPSRPTIPVESEDEDIPEDATIEMTEINLDDLPPPPPPPEQDSGEMIFVAYDEPPEPVGGFAAIQQKLVYPEIARKAGVEGRVYINVLIDERGNVIDTKVLKSLGNNGCDEAAIAAIRAVKWSPAKQRDKAVKVWVGIPVVFKLK